MKESQKQPDNWGTYWKTGPWEWNRGLRRLWQSFHGAGLIVPEEENDVGYGELLETGANLKTVCKTPSLQNFCSHSGNSELLHFANDNCDYGMGLDLGMGLFAIAHIIFIMLLASFYPLYVMHWRWISAEIIEYHLANRNKENIDQLAAWVRFGFVWYKVF